MSDFTDGQTKNKRKRGQPRIPITDINKAQIEQMSGLGMKLDDMASILGISPSTLDNWVKKPEILTLYKKGKAKAEAAVAKSLFQKAVSGDLGAIIWYEKTRCGRSDKTEVNYTGNAPVVIHSINLPDNQRGDYVAGKE